MRKFSAVAIEPLGFGGNRSTKVARKNKSAWRRIKNYFHEIVVGRDEDMELFVMGQLLVEKQTEYHADKSAENLFCTLLTEDFDVFKKHCLESSGAIDTRDPVGACVFHIAYLYGIYNAGRWLVQSYPSECLQTYGVPEGYNDDEKFLPYTGENILHMVIMSRRLDETEFLLRTYEERGQSDLSKLLFAEATGHFFQPGGEVGKYFGGFPLLFAVCSNGTYMVDLILKYASKLTSGKSPFKVFVDHNGNNALHMCVLHNLQDMFRHIRKLLSAKEFDEMMKIENRDGLSPFTLAATEPSPMFRFLLDERKVALWSYGPVTRFKIDLEGLDYPHEANMKTELLEDDDTSSPNQGRGTLDRVGSVLRAYNPAHRISKGTDYSAIELICMKNKLNKFEIPVIRQIVETKWERIGFPNFKYRFLFYLLVTLMLMLIVCLVEYQRGNTFLPWFTWCLYVTVFIILTYKFLNEAAEMYSLGMAYWGFGEDDLGVRGAAQLDNICSTVEFVTFATACFLKTLQYMNAVSVDNTDQTIRAFLSITVLTSWIYLYFFLLGFEMTGVFVVIVADILSSDMPKFLALFVIVLCGFGSSFALLHGHEEGGGFLDGLHSLIDYIWTLLVYTITSGNEGVQYFPYSHGRAPRWFYVGLVMLYNLCIVFLMLNLLIAMMSKTYEELQQTSKLIVLREKYNIMCSFERSYTPHRRTKARKKYSMIQKEKSEDGTSVNYRFFFQLEETDEAWLTTGNLSDPSPGPEEDDSVKKMN